MQPFFPFFPNLALYPFPVRLAEPKRSSPCSSACRVAALHRAAGPLYWVVLGRRSSAVRLLKEPPSWREGSAKAGQREVRLTSWCQEPPRPPKSNPHHPMLSLSRTGYFHLQGEPPPIPRLPFLFVPFHHLLLSSSRAVYISSSCNTVASVFPFLFCSPSSPHGRIDTTNAISTITAHLTTTPNRQQITDNNDTIPIPWIVRRTRASTRRTAQRLPGAAPCLQSPPSTQIRPMILILLRRELQQTHPATPWMSSFTATSTSALYLQPAARQHGPVPSASASTRRTHPSLPRPLQPTTLACRATAMPQLYLPRTRPISMRTANHTTWPSSQQRHQ